MVWWEIIAGQGEGSWVPAWLNNFPRSNDLAKAHLVSKCMAALLFFLPVNSPLKMCLLMKAIRAEQKLVVTMGEKIKFNSQSVCKFQVLP